MPALMRIDSRLLCVALPAPPKNVSKAPAPIDEAVRVRMSSEGSWTSRTVSESVPDPPFSETAAVMPLTVIGVLPVPRNSESSPDPVSAEVIWLLPVDSMISVSLPSPKSIEIELTAVSVHSTVVGPGRERDRARAQAQRRCTVGRGGEGEYGGGGHDQPQKACQACQACHTS